MTDASADGTDRLAKIRRYRRLMYASILVGVAGFVVGVEFDYPLVGLAVYWAGILGFFVVWRGSSVELFDERDADLERRASHLTVQVAGIVGVLTMTTLVVLGEATDVAVPREVWGGFLALSGQFLVFGIAYGYVKRRR